MNSQHDETNSREDESSCCSESYDTFGEGLKRPNNGPLHSSSRSIILDKSKQKSVSFHEPRTETESTEDTTTIDSVQKTVYVDPGLMSVEELLDSHGGRRRTLERLIEENKRNMLIRGKRYHVKDFFEWLLTNARIKISYDDFMLGVTIFVLFGDDMRLLWLSPSIDPLFGVLNSIAFFLFLIEIILYSWLKSDFSKGICRSTGYIFSFFFWLDTLAIVSMIPDLSWLMGWIGVSMGTSSAVSAKAGKASRIGAKAGRVVRMVRLVRLVKLYKFTSKKKKEKQLLNDLQWLVDQGQIDKEELEACIRDEKSKQSKVGAQVSDIITRRVIIAVLLMLCVVPLLQYYSNVDDEQDSTMFLGSVNVQSGGTIFPDCSYLLSSGEAFIDFMASLEEDNNIGRGYLVSLEVLPERCGLSTFLNFELTDLIKRTREDNIRLVFTDPINIDGEIFQVTSKFNMESMVHAECKERMYLTVFVVVMLVVLSAQFTGDAEKLVLNPIENMMEMVNMVAQDPLEDFDFDEMATDAKYEIHVVQVAIQKITSLLRVGFGVAGAEIISQNMAIEGGKSTVVDPMIPGKRVYAIFGFCDIHDFDFCTEKLEDEIMTFVNNVARIVHDEVTRWGGLCNKNLGNAFLMVWRIGDESALWEINGARKPRRRSIPKLQRPQTPTNTSNKRGNSVNIDLRRVPGLDTLSDKALIGFLRVIVEINRDVQVLTYRKDDRLSSTDKEFKLRMGFGLHAGWAIEGAVGSQQKVDATYLSPHVNMAARMEAASRQYHVPILITQSFFELMSLDAQKFCRKLDVVTVKGSAVPMPIYTCDALQDQTFPALKTPKFSSLPLKHVLESKADNYTPAVWTDDEDLLRLRKHCSPQFIEAFQKGISCYLNGDWKKAKEKLEMANSIMKKFKTDGDGPCQTILKFMEEKNFECHIDEWKGYRPLLNK